MNVHKLTDYLVPWLDNLKVVRTVLEFNKFRRCRCRTKVLFVKGIEAIESSGPNYLHLGFQQRVINFQHVPVRDQ